jgi:hypothetical protein
MRRRIFGLFAVFRLISSVLSNRSGKPSESHVRISPLEQDQTPDLGAEVIRLVGRAREREEIDRIADKLRSLGTPAVDILLEG